MADSAAQRQIPAPQSSKSAYHKGYAIYPSSLQPFRRQSFLAVNSQTGRFVVEQATVSEGANVSVPTPIFKSTAKLALGTGLLGGRVRQGRFFPQDLVGADVLRECSQSRDAEVRAADSFDGGESIQGRLQGDPQVSLVFFSVMSVANNFTCS